MWIRGRKSDLDYLGWDWKGWIFVFDVEPFIYVWIRRSVGVSIIHFGPRGCGAKVKADSVVPSDQSGAETHWMCGLAIRSHG